MLNCALTRLLSIGCLLYVCLWLGPGTDTRPGQQENSQRTVVVLCQGLRGSSGLATPKCGCAVKLLRDVASKLEPKGGKELAKPAVNKGR